MDIDAMLAQLESEAKMLAERLNDAGDADNAHRARNLEASLAASRRLIKRSSGAA